MSLSNQEINRYIGVQGQLKLKAAKVICIGSGGLGSPLLMYLAGAGVGTIGVVDFDIVEESNLHRQILHGVSTLGMSKVESAKKRLLDINPNIQVHTFEESFNSKNAHTIIEPYDIVVDGTDNFPTRYLVNDICVILDKPYVYGSIFKFDGQITVFNHRGCFVRPSDWKDLNSEERQ